MTYFVTHPCHPPIFNDETDPCREERLLRGVKAKQHIVCALMQGPEEHYALCEEIARTIYKPVIARTAAPSSRSPSLSRRSRRRSP